MIIKNCGVTVSEQKVLSTPSIHAIQRVMKQIQLGTKHGFHVLLSTMGLVIVEFWAPDRDVESKILPWQNILTRAMPALPWGLWRENQGCKLKIDNHEFDCPK